jgi:transportin-3
MADSTMEQRLFAAQTFRQKIEYDIKDLNRDAMLSLRDSLLGLLNDFKQVKNISTQLSISVADLAIQMNEGWNDPVGFMIENFGGIDGFPVLMEFLMVLPEELSCNTKITLESNEYLSKDHTLLKSNAVKVLQLMFNYMQQFGSDEDARFKILQCICSWLRSGSIPLDIIESSSLVKMAFEVLQDPSTFDVGVDIVCELILTSAKNPRNEKSEAIFQSIYPLLTNLVPFLKSNVEDGEIVRGVCRILVEAGEG